MDSMLAFLFQLWPLFSLWRWPKSKKISSKAENWAIELSNYVKTKSLSPLPFPGKIQLLFALFGIFLPGIMAESKFKGVGSKFDKYYFIHTIPGQLLVRKIWFKYFPVLRLEIPQRFKFGWFSWYHSYIS